MGVIKKNISKVGIFETSSEESLHIPQPSDDDCSIASLPDDGNIAVGSGTVSRRRLAVPTSHGDFRRNFGKKRLRRHENVNQLITLLEEDELGEVTIDDLIPSTRRGFIHILSDETAFQVWHEFIQSSEEIQDEILHMNDPRPREIRTPPPGTKQLTGDQAFQNIKTGLRNKLKNAQIPQGMLDYLEKSLVDFFTQSPTQTYISESITSFERLLLHAISQYHRLISQSIDTEPEKLRLVQVYNPCLEFQSPPVLLGEYLVLKRQPLEPVHS